MSYISKYSFDFNDLKLISPDSIHDIIRFYVTVEWKKLWLSLESCEVPVAGGVMGPYVK